MKWEAVGRWLLLCSLGAVLACGGGAEVVITPPPPPPPPSASYDLDALGTPHFIADDYIDLTKIDRISLFRSAVGHDYSDEREVCRSMKHYFLPKSGVDWATIAIRSPVSGTVVLIREEWAGSQYLIQPTVQPAFTVIIFHVMPTIPIVVGTTLTAGQVIGHHIGSQTMSDLAVGVNTPGGYRLVSWFDVITDGLFATYASRGVPQRSSAIISRTARDGNPLACSGETFTGTGTLGDWVVLN